jgi:hypothetical protein
VIFCTNCPWVVDVHSHPARLAPTTRSNRLTSNLSFNPTSSDCGIGKMAAISHERSILPARQCAHSTTERRLSSNKTSSALSTRREGGRTTTKKTSVHLPIGAPNRSWSDRSRTRDACERHGWSADQLISRANPSDAGHRCLRGSPWVLHSSSPLQGRSSISGHQIRQQGIRQSGEETLLGFAVRTRRPEPIRTDPKVDSYTSEKFNKLRLPAR